MKVKFITTMDWCHPVSIAIAIATRSKWSHCALGFELTTEEDVKEVKTFYPEFEMIGLWKEPHESSIIYFESHLKKDKFTGKSGTRGPYWFDHITEWAAEQPASRKYAMTDVRCLTAVQIWQSLYTAVSMVGKYGYDVTQLIFNLRGMLRGVGIPLNWRNKDKVTCSEYAARCLPAEWAVKHLGLGYLLYEEMAPAGKYGLKEMIEKVPGYAELDPLIESK